jgi:hypothetical protein
VLALLNLLPAWISWGLPGWAFKLLTLIAALLVALPLTAVAVRPLASFFVTHVAKSKKDLVGRVCVISTGRVDDRFGQALLEDGGAELILDVRCDTPGLLRKGDRVLLVSWDAAKEVFQVEAMDELLAERRIEAAVQRAKDAKGSADEPLTPSKAEAESARDAEGSDAERAERAEKTRGRVG